MWPLLALGAALGISGMAKGGKTGNILQGLGGLASLGSFAGGAQGIWQYHQI